MFIIKLVRFRYIDCIKVRVGSLNDILVQFTDAYGVERGGNISSIQG